MAFPAASTESLSLCAYAAEVAGRLDGLSAAETLIPEAERRAVLKETGDTILNATKALLALHVARITTEHVDARFALGRGRALDRAFDRYVAVIAETLRTGPGGGSREHPEFRKVFETGSTDVYQQPTIRDTPEVAAELERRLKEVTEFGQKGPLLTSLGALLGLLTPAASDILSSEKQGSTLFLEEVAARRAVLDALWVGKKVVEQRFPRDRIFISFAFFDFRKGSSSSEAEAEAPDGSSTTPAPGGTTSPDQPMPA